MNQDTATIIRNMVYILILELVLLPFGVFLYLIMKGFHIYHVFLGFGYLYGIGLIIETANLLIKKFKLLDSQEDQKVSK